MAAKYGVKEEYRDFEDVIDVQLVGLAQQRPSTNELSRMSGKFMSRARMIRDFKEFPSVTEMMFIFLQLVITLKTAAIKRMC